MAVFAFVEFPTVQAAADWMVSQQVDNIELNSCLFFDGNKTASVELLQRINDGCGFVCSQPAHNAVFMFLI